MALPIDAGCGTGLLLDRVRRSAREAWGLDLSGGMLAMARARETTARSLLVRITNRRGRPRATPTSRSSARALSGSKAWLGVSDAWAQ